jgi:hypothetical protein
MWELATQSMHSTSRQLFQFVPGVSNTPYLALIISSLGQGSSLLLIVSLNKDPVNKWQMNGFHLGHSHERGIIKNLVSMSP